MADPYAERAEAAGPLSVESGAVGSTLAELVAARGGQPACSHQDLAAWGSEARFGAVLVRDQGLVPPVARLAPEQAVMMLAAGAVGPDQLRAALDGARAASGQILLLKEGSVAGPAEREGAFAIEPEISEALLDAVLAGAVGWEADPDFGYEVPAEVDGFGDTVGRALCPRLLYADHDRVYEHSDLVVAYKRVRRERLEAAGVVDPELLAASGWPIEPTGQGWKG